MSDTRRVATVIGDNKFIEGYIVERLVKAGYVVRVAVPQPALVNMLRPMGNVGQITPLYCNIEKEDSIIRAVAGAEVVINCAEGQRGKNRAKLEQRNVKAAVAVAKLCKTAGVKRLIHLSALGANLKSKSPYLVTKKQGEEAVLKEFSSTTILRPSILFAPNDQFLNKLGVIASYFPIMPVYNVNVKLQPVYAGDVADAVIQVIKQPETVGQTYELAGPAAYTNRELMTWFVQWLNRQNDISGLTPLVIRLMAFTLQFMPGAVMTPALLNLMQYDSTLSGQENGLVTLGVTPMSIEMLAPTYLACYRPANDSVELKKIVNTIQQ